MDRQSVDSVIEYLTVKEVATDLKVSEKTVRREIKKGELDFIQINNCIRIPSTSLDAYKKLKLLEAKVKIKKDLTSILKFNKLTPETNFQESKVKKKKPENSWKFRDRSGYIVIRRQHQGKRYYVYKGRDEQEAKKALLDFESKILSGQLGDDTKLLFDNSKDILFKDYALKYIEEVSKPTHRTWKDDLVRYRAVVQFLKSKPLKDINYSTIKEYRLYRKKRFSTTRRNKDGTPKHIANGTINREICFISAVLREAVKDGGLNNHPLRGQDLKLEEPQIEIHPIKDYSKIQEFIENYYEPLQPVIRFALYTGLRLDNVLQLKRNQYNLEQREIVLLKQHSKNKKEQHFPLSDEAAELLESVDNGSDYFFPNPDTGKPYTNPRRSFKTAVRRTGLHPDTTFHDIRRSFGTNLHLKEGYPLKAVSKAMGHSSVAQTEKYLRIDSDRDIRPMVSSYSKKISGKKDSRNENIIRLPKKVATKVATL